MDTLGKRLLNLRKSSGLTQGEIGKICNGASKASVSQWEKDVTLPTLPSLLILKKYYGITLDELVLGHSTVSEAQLRSSLIPVFTWDLLDNPDHNNKNMKTANDVGTIPYPFDCSEKTYALIVEGHSMSSPNGRTYPEGVTIVCDPEQAETAKSGERVIARVAATGKATFKELVIEDGSRWLRPLNPAPQYQVITGHFDIIAKVIGVHIPE